MTTMVLRFGLLIWLRQSRYLGSRMFGLASCRSFTMRFSIDTCLCSVDYKNNNFVLYSSSTPYGPFSGPLMFSPCGTIASRPEWMASGWGGCYGGYMLPDSFGADGHDLSFVISIWNPYTTVLMTLRIDTSPTTGSTSQINPTTNTAKSTAETTSSAVKSTVETTSSGQGNITALVLPLSIAVLGCGIAVIALRRYAKRNQPSPKLNKT